LRPREPPAPSLLFTQEYKLHTLLARTSRYYCMVKKYVLCLFFHLKLQGITHSSLQN
jgi:hypothetical protein